VSPTPDLASSSRASRAITPEARAERMSAPGGSVRERLPRYRSDGQCSPPRGATHDQ
jgi:hypothetical protein